MNLLLGLSIMLMAIPVLVFLAVNLENLEHWPVALAMLVFAVTCIVGGAAVLIRRPFR